MICIKPNVFEIKKETILNYFYNITKKYKLFKSKKSIKKFINFIHHKQLNCEYYNLTKLFEVMYYSINLLNLFDIKKFDKSYFKLFIFSIFFHQLRINKYYNVYNKSKHYDIEVDIIEGKFKNANVLLLVDYLSKYKKDINIDIDVNKRNHYIFIHNIITSTDLNTHSIYLNIYDKYIPLIKNNTIKTNEKPVIFFSLILKCALSYNPIDSFTSHSNWIQRYCNQKRIEFKSINKICESAIHMIESYHIPCFNNLDLIVFSKTNYTSRLLLVIEEWIKLKQNTDISNLMRSTLNTSSRVNIIDSFSDNDSLSKTVCSAHNVCICMIDICNFSQWCSNQIPEEIFKTMTKFNEFLNTLISQHEDVTKVELVGDSVLIVGGLYHDDIEQIRTSSIMHIALNIINSTNEIENIFQDSNIGVRLGIHNGSVYSGYIRNPRKFQLFGNSINVASRLESTALQNTINISSDTMLVLKQHSNECDNIFDKIEIGKINKLWLKGVGIYSTNLCFLKKKSILIADDTESFCFVMKHYIHNLNYEAEIVRTLEEVFILLKRNIYTCVFLDRKFENDNVKEELKGFRIWEQSVRTSIQNIYLISTFEENEKKEKKEYTQLCEEILEKTDFDFYGKIKNIINKF